MDTKTAGLIGNIAKVLIGAVGFVLFLMILFAEKCEGNYNDVCDDTIPIISGSISLSMIALVLCAGIAILFGIVYFFTNIKKSKGAIIGLIGLGVLAGASFSMANGELTERWISKGVTEQVSQLAGAGVYLVLFLLGITIVAAILSEVLRIFK